MTRVLVTDAGRGSAMSIVRSLARRGIAVVAADANRLSPAFVSRHVSGRVVYPSPRTDAPGAVDAIVRAASEQRIDLVIPVGEDLVLLLSRARERFGHTTALALPEANALETARDKQATVDLAEGLGVPTPHTVLVRTASEALREATSLQWPIVLKPQSSRAVRPGGQVEAFGVMYAADRAALAKHMATLEGRAGVLLQEYVEGEGHGVGLLMDHGRPLLAFQYRRLREVPFTGGPSSLRESVALDPVLFNHSVRLLEALDWTGPAMVEFKVAPDRVSLMEINGRLWGSFPLAVKSGVDFPGALVDLYLGKRPKAAPEAELTYRTGVRSRALNLELSWIVSVLRRKQTPYAFLGAPPRREAAAVALRLLDPRDGYDILSLRDPLPGIAEIVNLAAGVRRRRPQRPAIATVDAACTEAGPSAR
jgi:predicted ATP-grasp superfamily ATP-dependent carboligase